MVRYCGSCNKEIEILKQIEKISLDKKLKKFEAKVYYKLGEIHYIAADFKKSKEHILNHYKLSIENFQKAQNSFKK